MSGIIRLRQSATEMRHAQNAAANKRTMNNTL